MFILLIAALVAAAGGGGGGGKVAEKPKQEHKAAQEEQAQGGQQGQQGSGGQADSGGDEGVVFRITGDPGIKFQGSVSTMDKDRSVQGVTPQDFALKGVDTGMFSADLVSGNAQKMSPGKEKLTVQIVVDGKVVKQASTTAQYGLAQVNWSASE